MSPSHAPNTRTSKWKASVWVLEQIFIFFSVHVHRKILVRWMAQFMFLDTVIFFLYYVFWQCCCLYLIARESACWNETENIEKNNLIWDEQKK
jgi:hypothetical protein